MISIIIPTLNEAKIIESTLRTLAATLTLPHEVIVSDGGSTDRTTELAARYANTVVLTFSQIEDLLGSALPAEAHLDQKWWTDAEVDIRDPRCSDCWLLAHRTAAPNLPARAKPMSPGLESQKRPAPVSVPWSLRGSDCWANWPSARRGSRG